MRMTLGRHMSPSRPSSAPSSTRTSLTPTVRCLCRMHAPFININTAESDGERERRARRNAELAHAEEHQHSENGSEGEDGRHKKKKKKKSRARDGEGSMELHFMCLPQFWQVRSSRRKRKVPEPWKRNANCRDRRAHDWSGSRATSSEEHISIKPWSDIDSQQQAASDDSGKEVEGGAAGPAAGSKGQRSTKAVCQ